MSIVLTILCYWEVEHTQTIAGRLSFGIASELADNPHQTIGILIERKIVVLARTLDLEVQHTIGNSLIGTLHRNLVTDRQTFLEYHVLLIGRQLGNDVYPTVFLGINLNHGTTCSLIK